MRQDQGQQRLVPTEGANREGEKTADYLFLVDINSYTSEKRGESIQHS